MRFTGGLLHYFRRWLLQKALLCRNGLKDVPVMKIMYVSEDLFRKLGSASENILLYSTVFDCYSVNVTSSFPHAQKLMGLVIVAITSVCSIVMSNEKIYTKNNK